MSDPIMLYGVNGLTEQYMSIALPVEELATLAMQQTWPPEHLQELLQLHWQTEQEASLEVPDGTNLKDLGETGWGVIFAENIDPAIPEALAPLLKLRSDAARASNVGRYREFNGETAYKYGQTKAEFLSHWDAVNVGMVNVDRMPYYLLLVGSPQQIPYRFQYELDVQYAVGRIHFETVQEYANYAQTVVDAEQGKITPRKAAAFFAPRHENDPFTQLCSQQLVRPLIEKMQKRHPDWSIHAALEEKATKRKLGQLLGGIETPSLLFTASHGLEFPETNPQRATHQGALVCQNWPGPWANFAAEDIKDDAQLAGVINFMVACYSAGTPENEDFPSFEKNAPTLMHQIESLGFASPNYNPFLAHLPQKLLGHPQRGAQAVIGHIERIWSYSFMNRQHTAAEAVAFEAALDRLLKGFPVGFAMEVFNKRYAELAAELTNKQEDVKRRKPVPPEELARLWAANNDARNYIIIGDPAVRLHI